MPNGLCRKAGVCTSPYRLLDSLPQAYQPNNGLYEYSQCSGDPLSIDAGSTLLATTTTAMRPRQPRSFKDSSLFLISLNDLSIEAMVYLQTRMHAKEGDIAQAE